MVGVPSGVSPAAQCPGAFHRRRRPYPRPPPPAVNDTTTQTLFRNPSSNTATVPRRPLPRSHRTQQEAMNRLTSRQSRCRRMTEHASSSPTSCCFRDGSTIAAEVRPRGGGVTTEPNDRESAAVAWQAAARQSALRQGCALRRFLAWPADLATIAFQGPVGVVVHPFGGDGLRGKKARHQRRILEQGPLLLAFARAADQAKDENECGHGYLHRRWRQSRLHGNPMRVPLPME